MLNPLIRPNLKAERERMLARAAVKRMARLGLPNFESAEDCAHNQKMMLLRFKRFPPPVQDWRDLEGCSFSNCGLGKCPEACWFATMHRRIKAATFGIPILEAHPGPKFAVTIIHPSWKRDVGLLGTINIRNASQWNYRRLSTLNIPDLLAVGGFEVSLNVELDKTEHWAGEIQQIVCGATKDQLEKAFNISPRYRKLMPNAHLVDVREYDSLALKFAYGQKRFTQTRIAFISKKNGRPARRKRPLKDSYWSELDAWLLSLPIGARVTLFGCSKRGTKIYQRKKKQPQI